MPNIGDLIQEVLDSYVSARSREPFAGNRMRSVFEALGQEFRSVIAKNDLSRLKIVWSVGQGNWAMVPWIAVLDERETTSTQFGTYCVYLFRADMSGVYLTIAQGVTNLINNLGRREAYAEMERQAQAVRDSSPDLKAGDFSFTPNVTLASSGQTPRDYEQSVIAYRFYESKALPDTSRLESDLLLALRGYQQYLDNRDASSDPVESPRRISDSAMAGSFPPMNPSIADILPAMMVSLRDDNVNMRATAGVVHRLIASLLAKRFLILTGLAGSGKTKIAQAAAAWLTPAPTGASSPYVTVVPVGADWTGNENVLGYADGLNPNVYVTKPSLELLRHAAKDPLIPHFLVLDEMNLSHVERYFADMLSAIESGEAIPLYEGGDRFVDGDLVTNRLSIPPNVFIIGTVNVDETTYMFSPKVLDRANVMEFRMEPEEIDSFLRMPLAPDIAKLNGLGAKFGSAFVEASGQTRVELPPIMAERFHAEMLRYFRLLQRFGAEFGYRTAHEAARFLYFFKLVGNYGDDDISWFQQAMDSVVVQKLMPKLHGSRSKLEGLLWGLAWLCGARRDGLLEVDFEKQVNEAANALEETVYGPNVVLGQLAMKDAVNPTAAATYPMSFDKTIRMWTKLTQDQFVTFAEA